MYFGGEKREDEAEEKSHFSARCRTVTGGRDFPVAPSELSGREVSSLLQRLSQPDATASGAAESSMLLFCARGPVDSPGKRRNMITARKAEPRLTPLPENLRATVSQVQ